MPVKHTVGQNSVTFTTEAKKIIDIYSTTNDKISVIYAKESNTCEYNKFISSTIGLKKFVEFDNFEGLCILCSIEDNDENFSYMLHKYKLIDGKYVHTDSNIFT
jgi:hypothetical protein